MTAQILTTSEAPIPPRKLESYFESIFVNNPNYSGVVASGHGYQGQLWERVAERTPSGAIRAEKYRRTGVVVLPRLEDERGPVICQARWDYRCRVERHVCPRHQSHGIIRAGVKVR